MWNPVSSSRRHLLIGAAAAALMLGLSPAHAETTLEKITAKGTVTIANGSNYPPMEYMENGENVGYDVDLGNELGRRLGLKVEWVIVDFKGIIGHLKSGRSDLIISGMTITPERAEQVLFSTPYIDFGIGAAIPMDSTVAKPEDLTGKTVGVEIGTSGEAWARKNLGAFATVKTYDSLVFAIKDLEAKRIDGVVNNVPALKYNLKGHTGVKVTDVWDKKGAGIAMRQEDKDLAAKVDAVLAEMKADGFLAGLDAKWFGTGE